MSVILRFANGREAIARRQRGGFEVIKTKGSAGHLRHPCTGAHTSANIHGGKDISVGTLPAILRQPELTVSEFNKV